MPIRSNITLPPPEYWQEFEDILHDLFRAEWKDPHAQKNGRPGQTQYGVDIFGQPNQKDQWTGVQAKRKDQLADASLTEEELIAEVNKAKEFEPKISAYILATTGQRDEKIQKQARLITKNHQKQGLFKVYVYSWQDIEKLLNTHRDVCKRWYPQFFSDDEVLGTVKEIRSTQKEQIAEQEKYREELEILITQTIASVTSSITISGSGSDKVYQVAIDQAKALLDQFKPKAALTYLDPFKKEAWDEANQITKWKILNNIASAKLQLNEYKEAAQLFIQAAQYNRDDEKALCNLSLAYILLDNLTEAEKYANEVLQKNAANERAFTLKIRIKTLQNEKFDKIIELIPEEFRNLQEVASTLGDAARHYGDLQRSQYWHEIAYKGKIKSPEISIAYATSMLSSIAENKLLRHTDKITTDQNTQLKNIADIYSEAYTKISDSEHLELKLECITNRGVAHRLKGDYEKAARDFDLAIELEPDNDKHVFQRAEIAFISGNTDVAISLLENIKHSKIAPAVLLFAEIYKRKNDFIKGIEVLRKFLENDPSAEFKENARYLLIELLLLSGNQNEADQESEALLSANQESIINLLLRARVLGSIGKEKEAKEHLSTARGLTNKNSPFTDILALADEQYALQDYENAAMFYEFIADISINNYITRNLLNCYYQMGNEKEVFKISTILRQNYGPLKIITQIESSIYEKIGDLEKAKEICKEYVNIYPEDFHMQLRLAAINRRKQDFNELDQFLRQKHDISEVTLEDRIHLSQLLSLRGFSEDALKIMYETRRKFSGEGDAHLHYIGVFLTTEKDDEALLGASKVTTDIAVFVQNSEGFANWYIIEDRQDADISKGELNLTHPLAKKLLGKKIGDKVVLVETPQRKEGAITQLKSKFVHAFHASSSILEAHFPDVKGFHILNLKISQDSNGEESPDFSIFFEMLDKRHKHFTQVLDLYKNGPLTIGALAKVLGINPIEALGLLTKKPNIGIRCASGDPGEITEARRVLASENPKFVIDISSIMTLHGLEIADEVSDLFGKFGIAQSTIDQIIELLHSRKGLSERGFLSVGKEGENYVKEEITAEQAKKNEEYLQEILNWIKEKCETISCEEALDINAGKRQELYNLFGFDALDSILLASQEKRILFSDDEWLRRYAKDSHNVDGVWSQAILEQLLIKGKTNNSNYQKLLIRLINSNYHYISISAETLEEAARQSSWKSDRQFEKIAGILSGGISDDFSALKIASDFIYKLYTQQIFVVEPSILLFAILESLFKSRYKRRILLAELKNHVRMKFAWLPALQVEVEQRINEWVRSRPFTF